MNYLQFLTTAQCICGMEIAVLNCQAFNLQTVSMEGIMKVPLALQVQKR